MNYDYFHANRKVLALLLAGAGFIASPATAAYAAETPVAAQAVQTVVVTGTVQDAEGPLVGVSVVEKGSRANATATDIDGHFSIKVPQGATLQFSYVGYATKEVKATAGMTVTLEPKDNLLNEVVAVGFGTQKRVNLTGSVSTVDTKLLNDRPVDNLAAALQGSIPGLQIAMSSGELNSNPSINVRGYGTIGDGSSGSPLVLIDGMEGDINALNPQDVESVSVLKDAAAASIYGSRAPFGVILIKTKKGSGGNTKVTYQNSFRFANLINMNHTMDSYTFARYFNQGCLNTPGRSPWFSDTWLRNIKEYMAGERTNVSWANGNYWISPYDPQYKDPETGEWVGGNANVDWYATIFKDSNFSQEHNLSITGGNEQTNYYISANFSDQDGQVRWGEDWMKRYSVTATVNSELYKWLSMSYTSRWNRSEYERPSALTGNLYQTLGRQGWPILPLYDDNGYLYDAPSPVLGLLTAGKDNNQANTFVNQLSFIVRPAKGWDIHLEGNYKFKADTRHWDSQMTYNHDVNGNAYVYKKSSNVHEDLYKENFFNINAYSNYDFKIGEKNDFHTMIGFQTENMKQLQFGLQRDGVLIPTMPEVDLTSGLGYDGKDVVPSVNGSRFEWSTAGFFGRINYNYDNRYLVEFNLRQDGTSRFRSNRRWITLPSASIGWNVANEKFWEDYTGICDQLKVRASWGRLGNQNTYDWYQTYRRMGLGISNGSWLQDGKKTNTAGFPALVSEYLTWERVENLNAGVDFSLLNGRLRGSAEYYIRDTKDMLGPAAELPATLGASVPKRNNCDLRTNGWDFELTWRDNTSFGLSYSVKGVLSDSRTVIKRYPNNPTNSIWNYIEGREPNEIWGYETIGIAKSNEEMAEHLATTDQSALGANWAAGDIMYRDLNGDGKVDGGAGRLDDHGDLKLIGNGSPHWLFSLDLSAEYKGFDVRAYAQGIAKRDAFINSAHFWGISGDFWWSNGLKQHEDYFRAEEYEGLPANLDSYYPRPVFGSGKNQQTQTRYLQNAAYLRLKNVQVGYTLPKSVIGKLGVQKVRFYLSGENLATFTKMSSLFDPETYGSGYGGCTYPLSRTLSFGLNLTI